MLSRKATVRLKDARQARTDLERLVCRIVQSEEPRTVSEIVERIAQEMYDDTLKHGGWAADIGLFRPPLFEGDALALLESMKSRCLSVEGGDDK